LAATPGGGAFTS
jgi:hypothetical protein